MILPEHTEEVLVENRFDPDSFKPASAMSSNVRYNEVDKMMSVIGNHYEPLVHNFKGFNILIPEDSIANFSRAELVTYLETI